MKRKKEDIVVLLMAIILVVVVLGIAFVSFIQLKESPLPKLIGLAPTPYPTAKPKPEEPEIIHLQGSKTILFNAEEANVIADLAKNRKELSVEDIQAKDKLLEDLFAVQPSGYVYESNNVGISYENPQDQFYVEIRTTDIDGAKKEAVDWFLSKGFTQEGLCKMPIAFTLSQNVIQALEGTSLIFSPRVPNCD